MKYKMLF